MITFEAAPVDHIIVARAAGKLTKEDIQSFVREVDAKLARHEKIGIVTDVTELDGMTLSGMVEDFRAELKYLGRWHRFPKLAVIASAGFIKGAALTFGKIFPQVEVRAFEPGEREQAIAFAREAAAP